MVETGNIGQKSGNGVREAGIAALDAPSGGAGVGGHVEEAGGGSWTAEGRK